MLNSRACTNSAFVAHPRKYEGLGTRLHSGHGRVVMIYYELCQQLWGGSPATEQISRGIESSELTQDCQDSPDPTSSTSTETSSAQLSGSTGDLPESEEDEEARNKR